jgi:hypothetical protein
LPNHFTISGLEPIHDPTWHVASQAQRAAYLRVCRVLVLTEWDKQTAAGLDKDGAPLRPIKASTRKHRRSAMGPADPNAPPLQPAHELSRTRSLVDAKPVGMTIRVFWKFDPISGRRWGTILNYHRAGAGHLPVRDVFGLSVEARQRVVKAAYLWWRGYAAGKPTLMPVRPRPGKLGREPMAIQPAYTPTGPTARRVPMKTQELSVGPDIYTTTKGDAEKLMGAAKTGRFTGFRTYASNLLGRAAQTAKTLAGRFFGRK